MSNQRCACPKCRAPFSVPTSLDGKAAKCPRCSTRLVIRAIGGKTTLQLAGVDGDAPTAQLPAGIVTASRATQEAMAIPKPSVARRNLRALGCGAVIVAVPLLLCCAGLVGVWVWRQLPEAPGRPDGARAEGTPAARDVGERRDEPVRQEARPAPQVPPAAPREVRGPQPARQDAMPVLKLGTNFLEIWHAFDENVVAAELKYGGKRIEASIPGKVDKNGSGYFLCDDVAANPTEGMTPGIMVYIRKDQVPRFADTKSQTIRVRATLVGKESRFKAFGGFIVVLTDAELVDAGR